MTSTDGFEVRRGLPVLTWHLAGLGADAVVTTTAGGVSTGPYATLNLGLHVGDEPAAVMENRRRTAGALGAGLEDLVFAEQVHGNGVTVVTRADRGRGTASAADALGATDALVTAEPGPVLGVLVADCVPIALADDRAGVVAAVHAGWRGTVAGVVRAAVEAMADLGARPATLTALVGPAVAPERYRVGPEVAEQLRRCPGGEVAGVLRPAGEGGSLVDLWEANRHQLVEAGVPAAAIHVARLATGAGGPFFSARGARPGPCGRFGLFVRRRP